MKQVKQIIKGKGKLWFIDFEDFIWCFDPNNMHGLNGDYMVFCLGDEPNQIIFRTKGPWCSNHKALVEDTGVSFI